MGRVLRKALTLSGIAPAYASAFDPLKKGSSAVLSMGNMIVSGSTGADGPYNSALAVAPLRVRQKFKVRLLGAGAGDNGASFGIARGDADRNGVLGGSDGKSVGVFCASPSNGLRIQNGVTGAATGSTFAVNDVIEVELGVGNQFRFSRNGAAPSAWISTGLAGEVFPAVMVRNTNSSWQLL